MTINLERLGHRIAELRSNRQISQESVADALGVGRMTIIQMERGLHNPDTLQLAKLADLFRIRIPDLFEDSSSASPEADPVLVLERISGLEVRKESRMAVERCIDMCQIGVRLGRLLERPDRAGPPASETPVPRQFSEAAEQGQRAAEAERRRLQLGAAPVDSVAELISSQSVWTAEVELPDGVSGLFLHHSSLGAVVLVNSVHGRYRKRFSLLHEYAHALMDRDVASMVSGRDNAGDLRERRANSFAASFLLPREGVAEFLSHLHKGSPSRIYFQVYDVANDSGVGTEKRVSARGQSLSARDVVAIARHFGASFQATCYRLFELGHIDRTSQERFLLQYSAMPSLSRVFSFAGNDEDEGAGGNGADGTDRGFGGRQRLLTVQVAMLAAEAKQRSLISRGKLLEIADRIGVSGGDLLRVANMDQELGGGTGHGESDDPHRSNS